MQRQIEDGQKELETKEFTATTGGGAVTATVNGKKELVSLKLQEEIVDPEDVETLQDSIIAAVNEAVKQAEAANEALMSQLNGFGGLPF